MGDDAALTEMAGVADCPTESAYAWALDYDDYELATRRFTPRRVTAAALAGSLVLVAVAGVVAVLSIRGVWHIPSVPLPTQVAEPTPVTTTVLPTTVRAQPTPGPWITPTRTVEVAVPAPVARKATWSYEVSWIGPSSALTVEEYTRDGVFTSAATSGATSPLRYATTGDRVGVDPNLADTPGVRWASCTLYIDNVAVVTSTVTRGDGRDCVCVATVA